MTPVQLANLALLKIGVSKGIEALDDATREAWTTAQVFDHTLRATLRLVPWPFATKYADLTLTQGEAWDDAPVQEWAAAQVYNVRHVVTHDDVVYYCILAHTAAETTNEPPNATYWSEDVPDRPPNGDWLWAYRYPVDCIFARRLVRPGAAGYGRLFHDSPPSFRQGRDSNGLILYSNTQDAELEYTTIDCDNLWADDLFIDAFTWQLAAKLAPSLSRIEKLSMTALQMYQMSVNIAATVAAQEQQQEKPGDAEWVTGR